MQIRFTLVITCTVLVSLLLVRVSDAQSDLMDGCPACCYLDESHLATIMDRQINCKDSADGVVREGKCLSFCVKSLPSPKFEGIKYVPWPIVDLENLGDHAAMLISCYQECRLVSEEYCSNCSSDATCLSACDNYQHLLNDTMNSDRPNAPVNPAIYRTSQNNFNFIIFEPKDNVMTDMNMGDIMSGSGMIEQEVIYSFILKIHSPLTNKTSYCPLWDNLLRPAVTVDPDHFCVPTELSYAVINLYGQSDYSPVTTQCLGDYNASGFSISELDTCVNKDLRPGFEGHPTVTVSWDLHPASDPRCIRALGIDITPIPNDDCMAPADQYITAVIDKNSDSYMFQSNESNTTFFHEDCQYRIEMYVQNEPVVLAEERFNAKLECSDHPARMIVKDIKPVRQPDCTYRVVVEWSVDYDIDLLESLDTFKISVLEKNNLFNVASPFGVLAKNISEQYKPTYPDVKKFTYQCGTPYVHYTCEEVCDAMNYSSNTSCVSHCQNVTFYQAVVDYNFVPATGVEYRIEVDPDEKLEAVACIPHHVPVFFTIEECPPSAPASISVDVIYFNGNDFRANVSWNAATFFGNIYRYVVYMARKGEELLANDTDADVDSANSYRMTNSTWIDVSYFVHRDLDLVVQVRADTKYPKTQLTEEHITEGLWSEPVIIKAPSSPSSSDDDDGLPAFAYAIIGIVVALILLIVIIMIVCLCCRNMGDRYYDKSDYEDTLCGLSDIPMGLLPPDWGSEVLALDEWELDPDAVVMQNLLGTGNFGEVYKAMISGPVNIPGYTSQSVMTPVAVKLLQANAASDMKHDFLQEIAMMKKVASGKNRYVVNMVGCCIRQEPLALVLEYVPNGNLLEYLRASRTYAGGTSDAKKGLKSADDDICKMKVYENSNLATTAPKAVENDYVEDRIRNGHVNGPVGGDYQQSATETYASIGNLETGDLVQFAWQIASGMSYLESLKIVHRDLACRNVLVGDGKRLKLSDFGLARSLAYTDVYVKTSDGKLPIRWMALESIMDRTFTHQSDVWSYGVTLWEISTLGGYPYPSVSNSELLPALLNGYRLECPNNCGKQVYEIMLRCWNFDPLRRPKFDELQSELDTMISAEQRGDQYIQINNVDEPYCQMFPAQTSEEKNNEPIEVKKQNGTNGKIANGDADHSDRHSITEEDVIRMQPEVTDTSV
ncbi:uncharacterized protein [Dysidea avara]|uniref:uncharacterized protein n=1 Tax=Dysidea avara TaxID=196820 RepID=UPI00332B894F